MLQNLILARNFMFKWFIVGFVITFLTGILFIFAKDFGAEMTYKLYNVNPDYYYNISITFFALIKLILLIFILAPALALHWMVKSYKKD